MTPYPINFIILSFIVCLNQNANCYVGFLHKVLIKDWKQHYLVFIAMNHINFYFPLLNFHES